MLKAEDTRLPFNEEDMTFFMFVPGEADAAFCVLAKKGINYTINYVRFIIPVKNK